MAYIMTTEAEIQQKSGANVNVAFNTTMMTASNLRGESVINSMTRYNWSAAVTAGLDSAVVGILSDAASSFVAMEAIAYDMSGYTTLGEAESMITVLRDGFIRNISILRDIKNQTFILGA